MTGDSRQLGGTSEAPVRIDAPCAWYGKELRGDSSWIWPFEDEHLEELDEALRASKARGLAEQELKRQDFPLPTLSAFLQRMLDELEHGRGFVLMRGFPVDRYDYADLRRLYWGIGTHVGVAESQNIKGELIQEIADLGFDPLSRLLRALAAGTGRELALVDVDGVVHEHDVALAWVDYEHWSHGRVAPERIIRAVVEVLLSERPDLELPARFDASTARRWCPAIDERVPEVA